MSKLAVASFYRCVRDLREKLDGLFPSIDFSEIANSKQLQVKLEEVSTLLGSQMEIVKARIRAGELHRYRMLLNPAFELPIMDFMGFMAKVRWKPVTKLAISHPACQSILAEVGLSNPANFPAGVTIRRE